jgi:multidrug efflux system membrane fusion protein
MAIRRVATIALSVLAAGLIAWRVLDAPQKARAEGQPAQPQVPVTTAQAQVQDVPVYLDGLGTVQAFNIVQIKAQVNGTLIALPAHEGQEVHKGDVVAEIDPRPYKAALDQAMAQRAADVAQLQSAQADLTRYQTLAKRSFAPVQQVDDQQATVNKLTASIAADTAAIETAQINLGYCVIRAPIDGRVSLYQVDVGNLIEVASQNANGIVSITQDKPISVVFTLPENDLIRVQDARTKGTLPVIVANNDSPKAIASGTLLTPNNQIDTTSGTITFKATFDNKDDHLWPGQFVNARVRVEVLKHVVTVPELAVEHGPDGLFVYTVKPDQTVAQTKIKIGYQDNDHAVVTAGLAGNETVVVSGQSRLSPGVHVKATDASKQPQQDQSQDQAADSTASPG